MRARLRAASREKCVDRPTGPIDRSIDRSIDRVAPRTSRVDARREFSSENARIANSTSVLRAESRCGIDRTIGQADRRFSRANLEAREKRDTLFRAVVILRVKNDRASTRRGFRERIARERSRARR